VDRPLLLVLLFAVLLAGICIAGRVIAPAPVLGQPVSPTPTAAFDSPDTGRLAAAITQLDMYAEKTRLKWSVLGIGASRL
jgi:hypothetical protein